MKAVYIVFGIDPVGNETYRVVFDNKKTAIKFCEGMNKNYKALGIKERLVWRTDKLQSSLPYIVMF